MKSSILKENGLYGGMPCSSEDDTVSGQLAQRTKQGILTINRDGMFYQDDLDADRHWYVMFAGDTYDAVLEWFLKNRQSMTDKDVRKSAVWQGIFREIAGKQLINVEREG